MPTLSLFKVESREKKCSVLRKTFICVLSVLGIVTLLFLPEVSFGKSRKNQGMKKHIMLEQADRLTPSRIIAEGLDSIVSLSGFDKPISSDYESFFIENAGNSKIVRLWITIDYLNSGDRQIHSRKEVLRTEIPPGESRQVSFRSFDRQRSFYYYKSRKPRTEQGVAPFKVSISVDSVSVATD